VGCDVGLPIFGFVGLVVGIRVGLALARDLTWGTDARKVVSFALFNSSSLDDAWTVLSTKVATNRGKNAEHREMVMVAL